MKFRENKETEKLKHVGNENQISENTKTERLNILKTQIKFGTHAQET
jgi:hypothetical protein